MLSTGPAPFLVRSHFPPLPRLAFSAALFARGFWRSVPVLPLTRGTYYWLILGS